MKASIRLSGRVQSGPATMTKTTSSTSTTPSASRLLATLGDRLESTNSCVMRGIFAGAATLPRRRAWLRIFVARCSLPCDPPVGGHSCNGGRIPRFHRPVCDLYGAIGVKTRVLYHLFVRPDGDHLLVPT